MTEIALIRHYPTDWNREGRLQGQIDRPLLPEARADLARLRLPPPWNRGDLLASPLSRALDTATLLADGRHVSTDPRLMEISWGDWEGRRSKDMLAEPGSGFVPTGDLTWQTRPPGGESSADAWARVAPLLAELARAGRPTLLISHKALMRIILSMATGGPETPPPEIKRGRIYSLFADADGRLHSPGTVVRLETRG